MSSKIPVNEAGGWEELCIMGRVRELLFCRFLCEGFFECIYIHTSKTKKHCILNIPLGCVRLMKSNVLIINYPSPFLINIFESTLRMTVALIFKLFSRKNHPVLSFSQSHVNTNAEICTFKPAWFMLIQWNAKNTVKYGEMWLAENWRKSDWLKGHSQAHPSSGVSLCWPTQPWLGRTATSASQLPFSYRPDWTTLECSTQSHIFRTVARDPDWMTHVHMTIKHVPAKHFNFHCSQYNLIR